MSKTTLRSAKLTTERKRASNQANAKHSTGPKTLEGKARVAMNALKHGHTAQTIVLPHEDPLEYQAFRHQLILDWQPCNETRFGLVDDLAADAWRKRRCVRSEHARLSDRVDIALKQYDDGVAEYINEGRRLFKVNAFAAHQWLANDYLGLEVIIEEIDTFIDTMTDPSLWNEAAYHRFLGLMGQEPRKPFLVLKPWTNLAFRLAARNEPEQFDELDPIQNDEEATRVHDELTDHMIDHHNDLVERLTDYPDPEIRRNRAADIAAFDDTKEGINLARHEDRITRRYRATLNQLVNLVKSEVDLIEDDDFDTYCLENKATEATFEAVISNENKATEAPEDIAPPSSENEATEDENKAKKVAAEPSILPCDDALVMIDGSSRIDWSGSDDGQWLADRPVSMS